MDKILQIPLGSFDNDDEIVWSHSKDGKYNVRSGYRVALADLDIAETSNNKENSERWNTLWRLNIPPKIKMFGWQTCKNLIPVFHNLWKRGVQVDLRCPRCGLIPELATHCLWTCPIVRKAWKNCDYYNRIKVKDVWDPGDFMALVVKVLNASEFEHFLVLSWKIWRDRNDFIYKGVDSKITNLFQRANLYLREFQEHQVGSQGKGVRSAAKWIPTRVGAIKINCDAAIDGKNNCVGLGAICRNEQGKTIGAFCDWKQYTLPVEAAEAKALLLGVRLARWLGVDNVEVESDCLYVIRVLNQGENQLHSFGTIINDILREDEDLKGSCFAHVGREGNAPAHFLAKMALELQAFRVWKEDLPQSVSCAVEADLPLPV